MDNINQDAQEEYKDRHDQEGIGDTTEDAPDEDKDTQQPHGIDDQRGSAE